MTDTIEEKPRRRKAPPRISEELLHYARRPIPVARDLELPKFPPNTAPGNKQMAMDEGLYGNFDYIQGGLMDVMGDPTRINGVGFLGFPYLQALSLIPEYRKISDIYARDATRKWLELEAVGEVDKTAKIARLNARMDKMRLREAFYAAALYDGLYGRGHLFIDLGGRDDSKELRLTIGNGNDWTSKLKIQPGGFKGVRAIEPLWIMPSTYESTNPLREGFYKPSTWFCQGVEVHTTRLLSVISHPVPDMFKPSYAFSGVSWTELAKPYVDRWLRTVKSVNDLIHAFSVSVLSTNMDIMTASGAASTELINRLRLFADMRDNRNVFVTNNDPMAPEVFSMVNTPIGGLDHLQSQSLEHIASVTSIPLILLTGISPSGLNATAEPELEAWNTTVLSYQESTLSPAFRTVLNLLQLSEFGEIDPQISFSWAPLTDMSPKAKAELREIDARTGEILVRNGSVSRMEERMRVAADKDAPYDSLDISKPAALLPTEKAEVASRVAQAVAEIQATGLVSDAVCLQELKNSSETTGLWTSITANDIAVADQDPPDPSEGLMPGMPGMPGKGVPALGGASGAPKPPPTNGKFGAPPLKPAGAPDGPFKGPGGRDDALGYDGWGGEWLGLDEFNADLHPRAPEGAPEGKGGQFVKKDDAGETSAQEQPAKPALTIGELVTWQGQKYYVKYVNPETGEVQLELARRGGVVTGAIVNVDPAGIRRIAELVNNKAIDVGGDKWNKETALRLESEYAAVKPELDALAEELVGKKIENVASEPTSWDALSSAQQDETLYKWKESSYQSFLGDEINNWQTEEAPKDAKRQVAEEFTSQMSSGFVSLVKGGNNPDAPLGDKWYEEAVKNYLESREGKLEEGEELKPLPFTPAQLLAAMEINGGKYDEYEDCDLVIADDKLNTLYEESHGGANKPELPLGLLPIDASMLLTEEMRKGLTEAIMSAFLDAADHAQNGLEAPDYLSDSVDECMDSYWEGMDEYTKFDTAKNLDIVGSTSGDISSTGPIVLPSKFDPLQAHSDENYRRTQEFARAMFHKRALQLIAERNPDKKVDEETAGYRINSVDINLWSDWKYSSTSSGGLAIQLAVADELGGRLRKETMKNMDTSEESIRADFSTGDSREFGGWDFVKALIRAKWETSQYILDKADIQTLNLYRGIELKDMPESRDKLLLRPEDDAFHTRTIGGKYNLPNAKIHRNGALSTTTDINVANNWREGFRHVSLRIVAPRTAVVSVPAYGINLAGEHEVVIGGTAWKDWDAWAGSAPEYPHEGVNAAGNVATLGVPVPATPTEQDKKNTADNIKAIKPKPSKEAPATGPATDLPHYKLTVSVWKGSLGTANSLVGKLATIDTTFKVGVKTVDKKIKAVVSDGPEPKDWVIHFEDGSVATGDHVLLAMKPEEYKQWVI